MKIFTIASLVFLSVFNSPASARQGVEPDRILQDMAASLEKARTLSYTAVHEYLGPRAAVWAGIKGQVFLKKTPFGDSFKTKLALSVDTYKQASDERILRQIAYNGRSVTSKTESTRSIEETIVPESEASLGTVSRLIGGNNGRLILWEFFLPSSPQPTLIQYDGKVAVKGVLCHVVYTEREYDYFDGKRKSMMRWFIGIRDSFPRRIEHYSISEEGRVFAESLTLANLDIDSDIADTVFEIAETIGYKKSTGIYSPNPKEKSLLNISHKAPNWTLPDPEGQQYSLFQFKNKILVMDFWAVWCGPCRVLMPTLQKIHDEFKDRGVYVIGIDTPFGVEGETSRASQYMKNMGYTYTLLVEGDSIAEAYQVSSLPTLYIVGTDGRILYAGSLAENESQDQNPGEFMDAYYDMLSKIIKKEINKTIR